MKIQETTLYDNDAGDRITRVRLLVADARDPDKRTEWIDVQVSVDLPTVRNGALLRAAALEKARDILARLAQDSRNLGDQGRREA
jgi:hypothetical protein